MKNHLAAPAVPFCDDVRFREQIAGLMEITAAINASCAFDSERDHVHPVTIQCGLATMEDGTSVDLLKIQAACDRAFRNTGELEFMDATDELAKLTGRILMSSGQWISC